VAATLGLAAASWVVAVRRMNGMDMGVATTLGSFAVFVVLWMWMMAAMMLPGAVPAVVRRARASGGAGALPLLVASYLAIWTLVGLAMYPLYRPHGILVAGAIVIAQTATNSRRSSGTFTGGVERMSAPASRSGSAALARALD